MNGMKRTTRTITRGLHGSVVARMPLACGVLLGVLTIAVPARAQDWSPQILEQDSSLDNLVTPSGYETVALGTLGAVRRAGSGDRHMLLIPGLGFGAEVFEPLMDRWADRFKMVAVTLPGFGGTQAPPTPPEGTSAGEQTWTEGAYRALEKLLESEEMQDVVVVGHWLTGTQLAVRLALEHPERVGAVVLLAGSARWTSTVPSQPVDIPVEQRVTRVDRALAPQWFKTVTRETWDDNNFRPGDYAEDPVLGLRLWREAARPPLHVWVRYLIEFFAQDVTVELDELSTPTLLVRPGLEGLPVDPEVDYMDAYTRRSWEGVVEAHRALDEVVLPDTRVVLWADRPDAVADTVTAFVERAARSSR